MAIAFDAASTSTQGASVSTRSWSHTCTGADLVLIVAVAIRDTNATDRVVSGITYNSVALTKIRSDEGGGTASYRTELWYLVNPSTGANNIDVTMGGTCTGIIAGGISLTGCDTSSPIDGQNGSTSNSATSVSNSITTVADNSWLIDVLRIAAAQTGETADGSQNTRCNLDGSQLEMRASTLGPITPAGSQAMGWSWALAGVVAHSVVSIKPLVAATTRRVSSPSIGGMQVY